MYLVSVWTVRCPRRTWREPKEVHTQSQNVETAVKITFTQDKHTQTQQVKPLLKLSTHIQADAAETLVLEKAEMIYSLGRMFCIWKENVINFFWTIFL